MAEAQRIGHSEEDPEEERRWVANRWRLENHLGVGGIGIVHQALDILTNDVTAVKISRDSSEKHLEHEYEVYKRLWTFRPMMGIPSILYYGMFRGREVMVMTHHGQSLYDRFLRQGERLSLKSVLMIGIQTLDRLEMVHNTGIIHGDIKPQNILTGAGPSTMIYLADFGSARPFIDILNRHLPDRNRTSGLIGTPNFASTNSHFCKALSRRDDLHSLAYMLTYLFSGTLPWIGIRRPDVDQRDAAIGDMKRRTTGHILSSGMPTYMMVFYSQVFRLQFKERPDYDSLRGILYSVLSKSNAQYDGMFDWDQRY